MFFSNDRMWYLCHVIYPAGSLLGLSGVAKNQFLDFSKIVIVLQFVSKRCTQVERVCVKTKSPIIYNLTFVLIRFLSVPLISCSKFN